MAKIKKFNRNNFTRGTLQMIREKIRDKKCFLGPLSHSEKCIYVDNEKKGKVVLAFVDEGTSEKYLNSVGYKKAGECLVKKTGYSYDFSGLENLLSRKFKYYPYVKFDGIAGFEGYRAILYTSDASEALYNSEIPFLYGN